MTDHARTPRPAPARPGTGRARIVTGLPGVTMIAGPEDPRMTERQLQDSIVSLCAWLHLLVYHTHDSRHSAAGFPDLVIVGSRVLYRELKSASGIMSRAQTAWLDALCEAGEDADEWRPKDWYNGRVRAELEALTVKIKPTE